MQAAYRYSGRQNADLPDLSLRDEPQRTAPERRRTDVLYGLRNDRQVRKPFRAELRGGAILARSHSNARDVTRRRKHMQTLQQRYPDLSVIVPVYNLEQHIGNLLGTLKAQILDGVEVETEARTLFAAAGWNIR